MDDKNFDRTLILVCGAARSGTTMLDLMLGNTDVAFSCGEIYAYFRPFRAHHFEPVCSCGDSACRIWTRIGDCPEERFHAEVFDRLGVRFVIDSSKDLRWVLDSNVWAQSADIAVANVLIWKEPMSLAFSHWKRGRPVGSFRRHFLNYYERFLRLGLPFVSVPYGELVSNPTVVLERLHRILGMPYETGREQFWEKQHHHFFGSAGTTSQARTGGSEIRAGENYPDAFVRAFSEFWREPDGDPRLARVIREIRTQDYSRIAGRVPDVPRIESGHRKPVWYYRHSLKAIYRRRFPETAAVLE